MNTDTPETDAMVSADQHHLEDDNFFPASIYWRMCDLARTLERERDEAREYADKLAEGLPDGMLPKDVEVLREANLNLAIELTAVTEQRDRLAEALRKCLERLEHHTEFGALVKADMSAMHSSREALQSLTPKSP
jgi:hypothetical protein